MKGFRSREQHLNIAQNVTIINNGAFCGKIEKEYISVADYWELEENLIYYGYDLPKNDFDALFHESTIPEEVLVDPKNPDIVTLTCDNKQVPYKLVKFMIVKFCRNKAAISVRDMGYLCTECYPKVTNYPKLETIQEILEEDPLKGLSVSKKIQYILKNNPGKQLTSSQIYEKGEPWESAGKTPRNTVAARCSTLHNKGYIKKNGSYYYLDG